MIYYQLEPYEQASVKLKSEHDNFHSRKYTGKCRLQMGWRYLLVPLHISQVTKTPLKIGYTETVVQTCNLQISVNDLMKCWASRLVVPVMATRVTCLIDLRTAQVYCVAIFLHVDTRPISPFLFFFNSTFYLCIIIVIFAWCIWYINWSCWQSYITLSVLMF